MMKKVEPAPVKAKKNPTDDQLKEVQNLVSCQIKYSILLIAVFYGREAAFSV